MSEIAPYLPLAAGVGSTIAGALVAHRFTKDLQNYDSVTNRDLRDLYQAGTGYRNYPALEVPDFNNAAWMTPREARSLRRSLRRVPEYQKQYERLQKLEPLIKRRGGLVLYDKEFKKPAIIAHELGHASQHKTLKGKLHQGFLRPAGAFAGSAAQGIGVFWPDIPLAARLGLILGGSLGWLPTLLTEREASKRGLKALTDAYHLGEEDIAKHKSITDKAFNTYLAAVLTPTALFSIATTMRHMLEN